MKIRMQVSIAGLAEPLYGLPEFSFAPGQVVDVDPVLAAHWLACGHAAAVPALAADLTFADLNSKTKAQLIGIAKQQLMLDVDSTIRKDDLINRITEALPAQTVDR
jgi:hypothetical protein